MEHIIQIIASKIYYMGIKHYSLHNEYVLYMDTLYVSLPVIYIYIYIFIYNSVFTCRQNIINSSASVPLNATNIAVKKVSDVEKKSKGSFYIAQYPVRWTAQSALRFLPSLADLFIPTPNRLLRQAF